MSEKRNEEPRDAFRWDGLMEGASKQSHVVVQVKHHGQLLLGLQLARSVRLEALVISALRAIHASHEVPTSCFS